MRRFAAAVVFVLASQTIAVGQDAPEDPATWFQTQPPQDGPLRPRAGRPYKLSEPGVATYTANYSDYEWDVFKRDGRVRVRRTQGPDREPPAALPFEIPRERAFAGRRVAYKVEDGWLVGFNAGEWGGTVWWFSKDGKTKYQVSEDRVVQFLNVNGHPYALVGLAHLTISRGKVVRLVRGGGPKSRWTSQTFAVLPQAPAVGLPLGNELIIVTSHGLVSIHMNGQIETLLSDCFWWSTYPNSLTIDDEGRLYIGMRQGVIRWRLRGRPDAMQWLVPSRKFLEQELDRFNRQVQ